MHVIIDKIWGRVDEGHFVVRRIIDIREGSSYVVIAIAIVFA